MGVGTVEHNFSELLRRSGELLGEVDHHDLLLRRRDGADVIMVRADREAMARETVEVSSALIAFFADTYAQQLAEGLSKALPWMSFLPEGDQRVFADEFARTLPACVSLGSFDQLSVLLAQWRNTAYVWSRPELAESLKRDRGDDGFDEPVPVPAAVASPDVATA